MKAEGRERLVMRDGREGSSSFAALESASRPKNWREEGEKELD